jgi:hypothetical protein
VLWSCGCLIVAPLDSSIEAWWAGAMTLGWASVLTLDMCAPRVEVSRIVTRIGPSPFETEPPEHAQSATAAPVWGLRLDVTNDGELGTMRTTAATTS